MTAFWALLGAVVIGGVLYLRPRLFPWKPCPRCNGKGRIYGGGGHRDCGRCGKSGRVRRFGAGKEK